MTKTTTEKAEENREALRKVLSSNSFANFQPIFDGFTEKGIAEEDIKPRENVFTYKAWLALNRQVRKGEHGVKISTMREVVKTDEHTGKQKTVNIGVRSTVFHISQTDPIE